VTIWGYARASSADQDTAIQEAALKAAGAHKVFAEKRSGTTRAGRDQLDLMLSVISAGDICLVTRVERLARSLRDLTQIAEEIRKRGASLKATEQAVDTTTPEGQAFYGMLGVFSQFETAIRKERQLEGIAAAKTRGVYRGRPKGPVGTDDVRKLKAEGIGPTEIAKRLRLSRAHVYRLLKEPERPEAQRPAQESAQQPA
jgi:DNA invertase Pin-like site-specific DNA recombinase